MTGVQIAALVIALNALIWVPVVILMRQKTARLVKETEDSIMLAGEKAVIRPESIVLRKPMFRRFGVTSGRAVVTLTDKRVIMIPLVGSKMEIPLNEIVEVRQSKWYRGGYRGGYTHVILTLQDGKEVALLVIDPERWMEGLRSKA